MPLFLLCFLVLGFFSVANSEGSNNRGESLVKLAEKRAADINEKYAREYSDFNPMIRYPNLVERHENWWYIENFRHGISRSKDLDFSKGRWTSAVIDANRVKDAAFLIGKFRNTSFNLGHVFSLFKFEDHVIHLPNGEKLAHLVISFEACRKKGEKYSMWDGAWSKYRACFVIGSFKDVLQKSIIFYKGMEILNLELEPNAVREFLRVSLEDSTDKLGLEKEFYNTVKNSCLTRQFDLLNKILTKNQKIQTWWTIFNKPIMRSWQSFWPGHTRQTLRNFGLLKSVEVIPNRHIMEERLKSLMNIDS